LSLPFAPPRTLARRPAGTQPVAGAGVGNGREPDRTGRRYG